MTFREKLNNANAAKRMTKFLGHSNIFATLSLSLSLRYSPTIAYTFLRLAGTRVNIRLFLHPCKGSRVVFFC